MFPTLPGKSNTQRVCSRCHGEVFTSSVSHTLMAFQDLTKASVKAARWLLNVFTNHHLRTFTTQRTIWWGLCLCFTTTLLQPQLIFISIATSTLLGAHTAVWSGLEAALTSATSGHVIQKTEDDGGEDRSHSRLHHLTYLKAANVITKPGVLSAFPSCICSFFSGFS